MKCPCGFEWPADRKLAWSSYVHRAHRDMHVAMYPDLDSGSRSALDELVKACERKERGEEMALC